MKRSAKAFLSIFALCIFAALQGQGFASNCQNTSVGFTPLMDLGSGTYKGYQGGLYPKGSNVRPAAHESAGIAQALQVQPLDGTGKPSTTGKIVLLGLGMSNAKDEFSVFLTDVLKDTQRDVRLAVVNGAQAGASADTIYNLNTSSAQAYWNYVINQLKRLHLTPAQVQVAWIKEADAFPALAFPDDALKLKNELKGIAQILKTEFPNIHLAYYSSRIYAGYATSQLNPEPFAYQSGFAVKWLIEDQINGLPDLNFNPAHGTVRAPWLSWGPYLWADGLKPRSDGLTWKCSDFGSDGTHPSLFGRQKVVTRLLNFFSVDSTSSFWFLRN